MRQNRDQYQGGRLINGYDYSNQALENGYITIKLLSSIISVTLLISFVISGLL